MAFEGWNDAGDAATASAAHLVEHFGAEPFADIDSEPFYDFSTTRPLVRLDGAGGRRIEWPTNQFTATAVEGSERDLVVLTGVEPQLKWRTFAEEIASVAAEFDVALVITLGALIADVTHSRPTTVYGTSNDRALCEQLDLEPSNYEGPTGIVGVVHQACQDAGLASMSLWAAVPSYAPHARSPKAALALVQRLGEMMKVPIETGLLERETGDYERQLSELVAGDNDTSEYVARLEHEYDSSMRPESAAAMVEELEQFLKDQ